MSHAVASVVYLDALEADMVDMGSVCSASIPVVLADRSPATGATTPVGAVSHRFSLDLDVSPHSGSIDLHINTLPRLRTSGSAGPSGAAGQPAPAAGPQPAGFGAGFGPGFVAGVGAGYGAHNYPPFVYLGYHPGAQAAAPGAANERPDDGPPQLYCSVILSGARSGDRSEIAAWLGEPVRAGRHAMQKLPASAALRQARLVEGRKLQAIFVAAPAEPASTFTHVHVPAPPHAPPALAPIRRDGRFSDALLRCGASEFPAHRVVLAAASPVLDRMLSGDAFVESRTAEVTLQEAEPAAVDLLLSHMYGGAIDVPLPLVPQLYGLADQYQVRSDLAGQLLAWLAAARLVPGALCGMLPAAHRLCARACEASLYAQAAAALGQVCRLPGFACWPLELVQAVARRAPFGEALGAVAAWMKAHEQRQQEEEQTYQQRPQKDAQPPEQQRQERQQEGVAAEEACDQGEQEQGSRPHDDERRRERLDCWRRERLDCWRQLLGSFDSSKATLEDLRGVRQLLGEGGGGSSSAGSPVGGGSGGSGGFGDGGGGEVPGLREWLLDAYDGLCGRQQLQLEGRRVRTPQPR